MCRCPGRPRIAHALTSVGSISCLGRQVREHLCAKLQYVQESKNVESIECPQVCSMDSCPSTSLTRFGPLKVSLPPNSPETPYHVFHTSTVRECKSKLRYTDNSHASCSGCDGYPYSGINKLACSAVSSANPQLGCAKLKDPEDGLDCKCLTTGYMSN